MESVHSRKKKIGNEKKRRGTCGSRHNKLLSSCWQEIFSNVDTQAFVPLSAYRHSFQA